MLNIKLPGWLVHLLMAGATLWLHLAIAIEGWAFELARGKAADLALTGNASVFLPVAGQVLVFGVLYGALFAIIIWLSQAPREANHWSQGRAFVALATWLSVLWLLIHCHNRMFPNSLWRQVLDPTLTSGPALMLDLLTLGWVTWRVWLRVAGIRAWLRSRSNGGAGLGGLRRFTWMLASVVIVAAVTVATVDGEASAVQGSKPRPGNVLVIGLDSLRRDLALGASASEMPNLAAFRQTAYVHSNVVTPLARTFPAWVTMLTGLHPTESGVRDNHAPQAAIAKPESIAWKLKAQGYRTVYATDETRFSNIGPDFGFDQVVGPKQGVSDFLLGQFSDLPLVNLAVQIPGIEVFLPTLVGNRAFAHAYRPARFVARLESALGDPDHRPVFAAVHLCAAHWPFYTADDPLVGTVADAYGQSARVLDRQFGDLLQMFRRQGYLDDQTLVVVVADHGEVLHSDHAARPQIRYHGQVGEIGLPLAGHGSGLLGARDWEVFAMFSGSAAGIGAIPHKVSDRLGSLEDLAPTILRLVGASPGTGPVLDIAAPTGIEAVASSKPRGYVMLETGFSPANLNLQDPDGETAARIAQTAYDVMPDGRVELKPAIYADIIASKEIGVTDGRNLLAHVVNRQGGALVSVDREAGRWEVYPSRRSLASSEGAGDPALLEHACGEPQLRARLGDWCSGLAEIPPPGVDPLS